MRRSAVLTRLEMSAEGTFGKLVTDRGFTCVTGELPWDDNLASFSCIPPGKYLCVWAVSPKHGLCYHVQGVPGRAEIEIHSANFMGDARTGLKCQLQGCIAPGTEVGTLEGQKAVLQSRNVLLALEANLEQDSFDLIVKPIAA